MTDPRTAEAAAMKLAELSRELDELENGRLELLKRLDLLRARLQNSGRRTAAMRASADLLCEHITNIVAAIAELRALEEEMQEIGQGLAETDNRTSGLLFETDSLEQNLDDGEDELDRLSTILIEGKSRQSRGH